MAIVIEDLIERERIRRARDATLIKEALQNLADRIDAAVKPGGHETDIVILRATKREAAMLYALIERFVEDD